MKQPETPAWSDLKEAINHFPAAERADWFAKAVKIANAASFLQLLTSRGFALSTLGDADEFDCKTMRDRLPDNHAGPPPGVAQELEALWRMRGDCIFIRKLLYTVRKLDQDAWRPLLHEALVSSAPKYARRPTVRAFLKKLVGSDAPPVIYAIVPPIVGDNLKAIRRAVDAARKRLVRAKNPQSLTADEFGVAVVDREVLDDVVEEAEMDALREAIRTLDEGECQILLAVDHEFTFEEMGELLGCSKTKAWDMHKALMAKLDQLIENNLRRPA